MPWVMALARMSPSLECGGASVDTDR
jgi:hypothetical protein